MEPGKKQQEYCNELTLKLCLHRETIPHEGFNWGGGGVILLCFSLEENILGSICLIRGLDSAGSAWKLKVLNHDINLFSPG